MLGGRQEPVCSIVGVFGNLSFPIGYALRVLGGIYLGSNFCGIAKVIVGKGRALVAEVRDSPLLRWFDYAHHRKRWRGQSLIAKAFALG